MKDFEKSMNMGNIDLRGLMIEESPNSLMITAKKTIYVPEKKIILMEQMTEQVVQPMMSLIKNKGGRII